MRIRAILALALAAVCLLLAGPASSASAYPITICSTLSVSTTNPLPGAAITVTGQNFEPNASVRLELHTTDVYLKTVTADASGSFTTTITLPAGLTGHHDIVATTGATTGVSGCPVDPFQNFDIQGAAAGAGAGGAGSGTGGGTAFTGVDVLAMLLGAIVLVGGGVLVNRGGKRRRTVSAH